VANEGGGEDEGKRDEASEPEDIGAVGTEGVTKDVSR
jgi:hypothetical protein